jgi:hypothetical protein
MATTSRITPPGGWVSDWWGFSWMILAEARGVLTPEKRTAAWRKPDEKLMSETNVVGVIRGSLCRKN